MSDNQERGRTLPHQKTILDEITGKIKLNPEKQEHYVELAVELVKTGKPDQAIKSFYKANSIKENYLILYNIGSLYYKKNDFKNAILVLEKSKLLNMKFHMTFLLAGVCYGRLNNFRAAETNFINVIMTEPDNVTALTALAILYHNQGRVEDSYKILAKLSGTQIKTAKKIKNEILLQSEKNPLSGADLQSNPERFNKFNDFIKSIPVEILTDKYGTIEEKISRLESNPYKTRDNLISLSLCHLFSGNTDSAIDYLIEAGSKIAV